MLGIKKGAERALKSNQAWFQKDATAVFKSVNVSMYISKPLISNALLVSGDIFNNFKWGDL